MPKSVAARRLTAGCVVYRGAGSQRRYLLLRAYDYWDFPKGRVEPGEEPLAAALREVEEETTLRDLRLAGDAFHETAPYSGGKVARYYLAESVTGEVSLPVSPELGRPEHHEFRWVRAEEARALVGPRVRGALEWADARLASAR